MQTYKFYDFKGRRCGIFLHKTDWDYRVMIWVCSLVDQFSVKEAQSLYKDYIEHVMGAYKPFEYVVDIDPTKNIQKQFIDWCKENYYKKSSIMERRNRVVLIKGLDVTKLNQYLPIQSKLS